MSAPRLELVGLRMDFADGSVAAIDGIDLAVEAGETLALLGPSNCGKSTTLNLIVGTVALDSNSIPVRNSGYNEEVNYTDCVMVLDTATLTPVPWLERTGRVICDAMWYDGRPQMAMPRRRLKKMLELAASLG